jgi:hypothetical protein
VHSSDAFFEGGPSWLLERSEEKEKRSFSFFLFFFPNNSEGMKAFGFKKTEARVHQEVEENPDEKTIVLIEKTIRFFPTIFVFASHTSIRFIQAKGLKLEGLFGVLDDHQLEEVNKVSKKIQLGSLVILLAHPPPFVDETSFVFGCSDWDREELHQAALATYTKDGCVIAEIFKQVGVTLFPCFFVFVFYFRLKQSSVWELSRNPCSPMNSTTLLYCLKVFLPSKIRLSHLTFLVYFELFVLADANFFYFWEQ